MISILLVSSFGTSLSEIFFSKSLFIVSVTNFSVTNFSVPNTAALGAPLPILIPAVESFDRKTASETFKGSRSANPHHTFAEGGGFFPEGVKTGGGGGSPGPGTKGGTLARPGVDRGRLPRGGAVQKGAMACSMGFLVTFLLAFIVTLSFSVLLTYSVASGVEFLVSFLSAFILVFLVPFLMNCSVASLMAFLSAILVAFPEAF